MRLFNLLHAYSFLYSANNHPQPLSLCALEKQLDPCSASATRVLPSIIGHQSFTGIFGSAVEV